MRAKRKGDPFSASKQFRRWHNPLSPSLLLWARHYSLLFSPLSLNVIRETCSYLCVSVLLPGVYEGLLYVVNVRSKVYRSVRIADMDLSGATFSPVDSSRALCLLVGEEGYKVYWLDMYAVALEAIEGHILCMHKPSVCAVLGALYMFRGSEGSKLVSEKYTMREKTWSLLGKCSVYYDIQIVFMDRDTIYIGQRAGSSAYFLQFCILSDELCKVISLASSFYPYPGSVHITTDDKKLLCLTEDFDLWLWHWSQFRTELRRPRKRYAQSPSTKGFTLLIDRELYWLDADQPEVHCFHRERLEWRWYELKQEQGEETLPSQGNCCVQCSPF